MQLENGDIICFQKDSSMDIVKQIRFPDVCSYLEYVHKRYPYVASYFEYVHNRRVISVCGLVKNNLFRQMWYKNESYPLILIMFLGVSWSECFFLVQVPFCPSGTESEDEDSSEEESEDEDSSEEQNENITAEETNVDKIIEGTSKANTSKFVIKDLKEVDAMIKEDVIAAIDRVLSEGITISVKSQHSVQEQEVSKLDPNLPEKLLQELWDIVYEGDLIDKLLEGLITKDNFNAVTEKIDANADLFSSKQLEQVSVFVDLVNNIVRISEKIKNLEKEQDSAKKCTRQDNKALKETRKEILISRTFFGTHQNRLNSLDAQIADLNAKLEKLQVERAKVTEGQDQEKDKIASLNKEVKSIFHRLADDQIKLKSVEDQFPDVLSEWISHYKLYRIFQAVPPFWYMSLLCLFGHNILLRRQFSLLTFYFNIMNTWHFTLLSFMTMLVCARGN